MILLGIDLGTSAIKVSLLDAQTRTVLGSASYPETEATVQSPKPGWAEQDPESWWTNFKHALSIALQASGEKASEIAAIGISYQMHGLVLVDESGAVLRPAIIWSDSRAVLLGEKARVELGEEYCSQHLLNSPGNFTASKLAWVKENEPAIYSRIHKFMLPGDYIAFRLGGEISTTYTGLSEGILYDFKQNEISRSVLSVLGLDAELVPPARESFSVHCTVTTAISSELGLKAGIPISYKAGDQPNNALSLNVLEPGEVAATAGTSGVIYAVTDRLSSDRLSRINTFAHVNHQKERTRLGILLCINGAGSMNRWSRQMLGTEKSYKELNALAAAVAVGSDGVLVHPFGNGAERMLENKNLGASLSGLDLNTHAAGHLLRATQEGIACAFKYGFDVMRENGVNPSVIRAGHANMFLSEVFSQSFVDLTQTPVELYASDGSVGAALGAGIGARIYASAADATSQMKIVKKYEPGPYMQDLYSRWQERLGHLMHQNKFESVPL